MKIETRKSKKTIGLLTVALFAVLAAVIMISGSVGGTGVRSVPIASAASGIKAQSAATSEFYMEEGASIRTDEPYGIRFRAFIAKNKYESCKENDGKEYKVGMFVFPSAYLTKSEAYTGSAGEYATLKQKVDLTFYDSTTGYENVSVSGDGTEYILSGVVKCIYLENYDLNYIGIAYIATRDGETVTYKYADFDAEKNSRSASETANDGYIRETENRAALDDYIDGAYLKNKGVTRDADGYYVYNENLYQTVHSVMNEIVGEVTVALEPTLAINKLAETTLEVEVKNDGEKDAELSKIVNFTSSDDEIVSVDKTGKITGKGIGKATVTARYKDKTAKCEVTVSDNREVVNVPDKQYYGLSSADEAPLNITLDDGAPVYVSVDGTNLTEAATFSGNTASIPFDSLKGFARNEQLKTVRVETTEKIYNYSFVFADYLVSDTPSWLNWYEAWLSSVDSATSTPITNKYVVVTKDFTYTGEAKGPWHSHNYRNMTGFTIDGNGHVIDGLKFRFVMAYELAKSTIKNLALTNLSQESEATGMLSRIAADLTIENCYFHGTAKTNNIIDQCTKASTIRNTVFNISCTGTSDNLLFDAGDNPYRAETTVENVIAIASGKTGVVNMNGSTGGTIYSAVSDEMLAKVQSDFTGTYFTAASGKLYFNGKAVATVTKEVAEHLYFKKGGADNLTVPVESGTASKVRINGTEITGTTQSDNNVTIPVAAVDALSTGGTTLTVETDGYTYNYTLMIADYLVSDTASLRAWYSEWLASPGTVISKYIVVTNDIVYDSEETLGTWSGNSNNNMTRLTIDGDGHTIDGLKLWFVLAYTLDSSTMKNLALTNIVQYRKDASQSVNGTLFRVINWASKIENCYFHGTAISDNIIAQRGGNGTSSISNTIFNISCGNGSDNLFFDEGNSAGTTVENVMAIASGKTGVVNMNGSTVGTLYSAVSDEMLAKVQSDFTGTYFTAASGKLYFNGKEVAAVAA